VGEPSVARLQGLTNAVAGALESFGSQPASYRPTVSPSVSRQASDRVSAIKLPSLPSLLPSKVCGQQARPTDAARGFCRRRQSIGASCRASKVLAQARARKQLASSPLEPQLDPSVIGLPIAFGPFRACGSWPSRRDE